MVLPYGMIVTIDKAGRIVVPKQIRERLNLREGTELELELDTNKLIFCPIATESALVRKKGLLVHQGKLTEDVNVVDFIQRQREEGNR